MNVPWSFLVLEFLCVDENKPGKIAWMMRSARWMALGTRCSGRLHETSRCATMLTTKSETVTATIRHSRSCSTTASMSHILCSSTLAITATSCWPPKHPQLEFYQLLTTMGGGGGSHAHLKKEQSDLEQHTYRLVCASSIIKLESWWSWVGVLIHLKRREKGRAIVLHFGCNP